jgi:PAS domain S-box-containing protein
LTAIKSPARPRRHPHAVGVPIDPWAEILTVAADLIAIDKRGRAEKPDIVVRADPQGVIFFVSDTCRVLGYEPDELIGKSGLELVHPDDRARFIENTASLFAPGSASRPAARVHRFLRRDGSWIWLRGNPRTLSAGDGRPGEVLNFLEPISAEEAARVLMPSATGPS